MPTCRAGVREGFQTFLLMNTNLIVRIREFMENEARSCSMDFGCVTPEYVYRMWERVLVDEIANAMTALRHAQEP